MSEKILHLLKNNHLLVAFVLLGTVSLILGLSARSPSKQIIPETPDLQSADTYIPAGHVLVPIEVANAEALSSLVGEVGGVVDLYLPQQGNKLGGKKIGSRLKILRAPLNPQQYAVLIKDSEGSKLLSYSGPFIAVVQNPRSQGANLATSSPSKIRVDYQN